MGHETKVNMWQGQGREERVWLAETSASMSVRQREIKQGTRPSKCVAGARVQREGTGRWLAKTRVGMGRESKQAHEHMAEARAQREAARSEVAAKQVGHEARVNTWRG